MSGPDSPFSTLRHGSQASEDLPWGSSPPSQSSEPIESSKTDLDGIAGKNYRGKFGRIWVLGESDRMSSYVCSTFTCMKSGFYFPKLIGKSEISMLCRCYVDSLNCRY